MSHDFFDVHSHVPRAEPIDLRVLMHILDSFETRPWTLRELMQLGDPEDIRASIQRLCHYGHVQTISNYVVATRAAIYFHRLLGFAQEPPDNLTNKSRRPTA